MAGKFEIYKDKAGEFRFRLKAGNGQIILASEGYKAKTSCKNGIESVRKNSQSDDRFERRETKTGKARFNLKAANGQVIGVSESYESTKARDNGIASVAKNAPDAKVDDQTLA
ncbi:MAG: YegP family protein [Pseudomonadota bacterium]